MCINTLCIEAFQKLLSSTRKTNIMSFQMFPAYCRELGSGLSTCFGFTMFYIVIQISPYLLTNIGTSMTFYIFGSVSGIGAIFLYFCLPETKNKTMNDNTT